MQSVSSPSLGELLALRIVGQNSVLVSLPQPLDRGRTLTFDFVYSGRLDPQGLDREAIAPQGTGRPRDAADSESPILLPEPRFLYSNRVYWYPQAAGDRLRDGDAADHRAVRIPGGGERAARRLVGVGG